MTGTVTNLGGRLVWAGATTSAGRAPLPRPLPGLTGSGRRAFTLPEVLAALVLIGVVLPAVLKGVSLALGACDDAKRKVVAAGLAETKLAELTADAMLQVSSSGGSGDFAPLHPEYRWQAQSASADTDLTELTVIVAWTARGSERTVELSTLVFTGAANTSSSSSGAPSGAAGGGT